MKRWLCCCLSSVLLQLLAYAQVSGPSSGDPMIQADIIDVPPPNKTYASGINADSIILKLNGTQVIPIISDIPNGKHVYYLPSGRELNHSGNNTVELMVRDNANAGVLAGQDINDAGNPTDLDPFTWEFTLP
jgi:hypothetical protein